MYFISLPVFVLHLTPVCTHTRAHTYTSTSATSIHKCLHVATLIAELATRTSSSLLSRLLKRASMPCSCLASLTATRRYAHACPRQSVAVLLFFFPFFEGVVCFLHWFIFIFFCLRCCFVWQSTGSSGHLCRCRGEPGCASCQDSQAGIPGACCGV